MAHFDEDRYHRTNGVGMTHLEIMGMTAGEALMYSQSRERARQISLGCVETECIKCKDFYWNDVSVPYKNRDDICPGCSLGDTANLDKDYSENDERNFV